MAQERVERSAAQGRKKDPSAARSQENERGQKRGRGAKAENTRKQILQAAEQVIGRKGYADATVSDIAAEANVSKGLLYYHFKSKAEIGSSVLANRFDALMAQLDEVGKNVEDPTTLNRMLNVVASAIFDNHSFGRFLLTELFRGERAWSDQMREREQTLFAFVREHLSEGQKVGLVRKELDLEFQSVAIVSALLTTALYYLNREELSGQPLDKDAFLTQAEELVRHGLSTKELN